jgi:LacI family transcriptional regulator
VPGIPIEGLKQLAQRTGLSVSTVSRILNGKSESARISPATSERVLEEARRQGIVLNVVARGLRLRTTQTLGLLIPDISNPFFAALARQVERASRARSFSVLLGDSEEDSEIESHNARLMQSRQVDALIVAPVGDRHEHLRQISASLPLIVVDRIFPELDVPSVSADNSKGAVLAVEHLVAAGHRKIGCIQGLAASSANSRDQRCGTSFEGGLDCRRSLLAGVC